MLAITRTVAVFALLCGCAAETNLSDTGGADTALNFMPPARDVVLPVQPTPAPTTAVPVVDGLALDYDDDGYTVGHDCDDRRDNVHPGAVELCDGVDNDCNGVVDDLADIDARATCAAGKLDEDEDGVTVAGGDCDDHDARVRGPNAPELCDGIDNDCNGLVDEDAACG